MICDYPTDKEAATREEVLSEYQQNLVYFNIYHNVKQILRPEVSSKSN